VCSLVLGVVVASGKMDCYFTDGLFCLLVSSDRSSSIMGVTLGSPARGCLMMLLISENMNLSSGRIKCKPESFAGLIS
jgi:hypothetical protein